MRLASQLEPLFKSRLQFSLNSHLLLSYGHVLLLVFDQLTFRLGGVLNVYYHIFTKTLQLKRLPEIYIFSFFEQSQLAICIIFLLLSVKSMKK